MFAIKRMILRAKTNDLYFTLLPKESRVEPNSLKIEVRAMYAVLPIMKSRPMIFVGSNISRIVPKMKKARKMKNLFLNSGSSINNSRSLK
jgi:hypothetical protein